MQQRLAEEWRRGCNGNDGCMERNGGKGRELEGSPRMSRGLSRREAGDGYSGSTGGALWVMAEDGIEPCVNTEGSETKCKGIPL